MKKYMYPKGWFFITMQIIATIVTLWAIFNPAGLGYWMLSLFGYFLITCLGISVTFHRLLTHKSYKVWKPIEYLFSYFGNIGCTGSSVGWVFVHRMHHRFADKHGDPHSPVTMGALGAIVGDYSGKFNKWEVRDIIHDPIHRFMHEYYMLIVVATVLVLYMIDPLLSVYLFWIPMFLNTVASRLSNWIDHTPLFGRKVSNDSTDQSHNVWWWALLTFGEGWHNNHHRSPKDYTFKKQWWEFDMSGLIIKLIKT
jgi:fatty-acid desaturase